MRHATGRRGLTGRQGRGVADLLRRGAGFDHAFLDRLSIVGRTLAMIVVRKLRGGSARIRVRTVSEALRRSSALILAARLRSNSTSSLPLAGNRA